MIKILSLLAISISVFYSPSINAHSYGGTENHTSCESGDWNLGGHKDRTGYHMYNDGKNKYLKYCNP